MWVLVVTELVVSGTQCTLPETDSSLILVRMSVPQMGTVTIGTRVGVCVMGTVPAQYNAAIELGSQNLNWYPSPYPAMQISHNIVYEWIFVLSAVNCTQHHRTAMSPHLNSEKNGDCVYTVCVNSITYSMTGGEFLLELTGPTYQDFILFYGNYQVS